MTNRQKARADARTYTTSAHQRSTHAQSDGACYYFDINRIRFHEGIECRLDHVTGAECRLDRYYLGVVVAREVAKESEEM